MLQCVKLRPLVKKLITSPNLDSSLKGLAIHTSGNYCTKEKPEEMDHFKDNPYFAKYASKLQSKADANPEEFQANVNKIQEDARLEEEEKKKSLVEAMQKQKEKATQKKAKGLDGIMKVELLQDKTAEEITELWKEFHSHKNCVYSVIPKDEYDQMYQRSKEFPTFIYPLAREAGYEFMLQQFDGHDCHFTPLIMYQRHQENAPPCLSISHFTDLAESRGIVLMNSELDKDIISVNEAQLLALQVKMYYGLNSGLKFNLVRLFKNSPNDFRHMDLIVEFEKYKKDCQDVRDGTWV